MLKFERIFILFAHPSMGGKIIIVISLNFKQFEEYYIKTWNKNININSADF